MLVNNWLLGETKSRVEPGAEANGICLALPSPPPPGIPNCL